MTAKSKASISAEAEPSIAARPAEPRRGRLSAQEATVARILAVGHTHREIAKVLGVSEKIVERHLANAMRKANASSTAELARYAIRARRDQSQ